MAAADGVVDGLILRLARGLDGVSREQPKTVITELIEAFGSGL